MHFRMWHILALMALILLAGVLSVRELEDHVGRSTVPGVVVIDAPGMDFDAAEATVRRWPSAGLLWAPAGEAPLSPFGPDIVRALRTRRHASALVRPRPATGPAPDGDVVAPATDVPARAGMAPSDPDEALHDAWGVLARDLDPDAAAERLADFIRGCDGVRPFIVGLQFEAPTVSELVAAVARLVDAAESLPDFRHTTVVVLGMREPQAGRRLAVRMDLGDLDRAPPPGLRDLLERAR
jgi:hypothetical protein